MRILIASFTLLLTTLAAPADDWGQWLGPKRDVHDASLLQTMQHRGHILIKPALIRPDIDDQVRRAGLFPPEHARWTA